MGTTPIPIGWIFTVNAKYFSAQSKRGDTYCNGAFKVVKINYAPRKWWQFWKKRVAVSYSVQRIK